MEELTGWGELIFYLQYHSFSHILQQAYDFIMSEFGQVNPIHWLDVVTNV